jgi:predicted glutamine amidotransferase
MCRMFAYVGDSTEDLLTLVKALRASSRRDTIGEKAIPKLNCHPDGWGYVISSEAGLFYFRSDRPMYEEEQVIPQIKGRAYAIFHARKGLDGTPVKRKFSHPFLAQNEESFVFLAHNGSVDKARLVRELGFSGEAVDSELALRFILQKSSLEEGTKELEDYTEKNGGLDLLILQVDKNGEETRLLAKQYYRKEPGRPDLTEFYAMYHQYLPGGEAIFSSTLNDYGLSGAPVQGKDLMPVSALGPIRTVA